MTTSQLVKLSATVFVLEKLLPFPWDLFCPGPSPRHLLNLSIMAFFETAVMSIWRVIDNTNSDATLAKFRNEIRKNIQDETKKQQFDKFLKRQEFSKNLRKLCPKIETLRHNYFAHLNLEKILRPTSADL
jgi:hypothetical protein